MGSSDRRLFTYSLLVKLIGVLRIIRDTFLAVRITNREMEEIRMSFVILNWNWAYCVSSWFQHTHTEINIGISRGYLCIDISLVLSISRPGKSDNIPMALNTHPSQILVLNTILH